MKHERVPGLEQRHVDEMREEVLPLLYRTVVALGSSRSDGSDPYPFGTGTLIVLANHHFLVTAAHVISEMEPHGGTVTAFAPGDLDPVDNGRRKVQLIPITGNTHRVGDPFDVAVIHLDAETAQSLSKCCNFLRLQDVALGPEYRGCNWVHGFPNASIQKLGERSNQLQPFTLMTHSIEDDGEGFTHFDTKYHFVLQADPSHMVWSEDGAQANVPKLHGISGSAIWQTWWPSKGDPDVHRARAIKIVGVQVTHLKSRGLIKATRWGCVANLISQAFPSLRPILDMHLRTAFGR